MLEIRLPYPPSINHYWRRIGPRTLISREGRRFRKNVVAILAALKIKPLAGPLAIQVYVFPPDRRRRDIDNLVKALLDALEHGGAFADDSQIVELHVLKRQPFDGGKILVQLRVL